jgi:hypothetical protein
MFEFEDTYNDEMTEDFDGDSVGAVSSVDADDVDDVDDSIEDVFDGMDDNDLNELDSELRQTAVSSVMGGGSEEERLSPEEEIEADDMMQVAATTLLVNDKLNDEEKKEFIESASEVNAAINEGFMTPADVDMMAESLGLVEEKSYNKPMLIRLDAESKKKQLYALAVNVSACAHKDPDYVKLKKVMKMRKILRAKLDRKYHAEAMKRMKIYYARLRRSKSTTLNKVANK